MNYIRKLSFVLVLFVILSFLFFNFLNNKETTVIEEKDYWEIKLDDSDLLVEVADTNETLIKGLSGRNSIGSDGLLMVFKEESHHGIWMKEMKFPIDIIWINSDGRTVYIEKNVDPKTYPKVFRPDDPAKFVLEVSAGLVDEKGWGIDSIMTLKDKKF